MSSSASKPRPLSPHLQIYRPQITSVMSILHRITGVGLCAAMPVLVWWLVALSQGPEAYATFRECLTTPIAKLFLSGWAWALAFHMSTGIRHLLWDAGWGFDLKQVYTSGRIALVICSLITLVLWYAIWIGG